jgi:hypothetical protein
MMDDGQGVKRLEAHWSLQWKSSGSAGGCGAPGLVKLLEVEPRDDLHQTSAGIVGVGRIPVGLRHLHEVRIGECCRRGGGRIEEVDVVECVQELGSHLEVVSLADPDLLLETQIEAYELRPGDEEVLRGALAAEGLNAVRAVGWREVTSRRRAAVAVTGCRVALTLKARIVLSMMSCGRM